MKFEYSYKDRTHDCSKYDFSLISNPRLHLKDLFEKSTTVFQELDTASTSWAFNHFPIRDLLQHNTNEKCEIQKKTILESYRERTQKLTSHLELPKKSDNHAK